MVDIETTHLDPTLGGVLEVAAHNIDTDEKLYFVPHVSALMLGNADGVAMQINRWYERGCWKDMLAEGQPTRDAYAKLAKMLKGNTFGAMNPTFDLGFLSQIMQPTWHYAPADVGAYVAGALGMHPAEVPRLVDLADRFGIDSGDAHGAQADVEMAVKLWRATMKLRAEK